MLMVESQVSCLSSWDERFGLPRNTLHQNLQVATGKASPWQEDDFKRASQMEGGLARDQEMFAEVCAALAGGLFNTESPGRPIEDSKSTFSLHCSDN